MEDLQLQDRPMKLTILETNCTNQKRVFLFIEPEMYILEMYTRNINAPHLLIENGTSEI